MADRPQDLMARALRVIPGGVNSPVRAFKGVGGEPVFFDRGQGAYLWDVNGKRYIDYVSSWGPMILGHAHPRVVQAVQHAAERGLGFGAPTAIEVEMAELLRRLLPSMEKVRMVNSGTEATMSAIRLARGYTGRDKIIKFEGCYHGHADALLAKAGSGILTLGLPASAGVPESITRHTAVLEYNNLSQTEQAFAAYGNEIAAVIVEPVAGNMNCIPPAPDFLPGLRRLCSAHGALLIFDEVITGFRVALGGAQALYRVTPDLTTLGKIIGGGLPVGAFGGLGAIMDRLAPEGPVYQAGTLSGNPVALAAGLATLKELAQGDVYGPLAAKTKALIDGLKTAATGVGVPFLAQAVGGLFGLFFTDAASVSCYAEVMACNQTLFKKFFHGMLRRGVYLAPSAFEAGFMSMAHSDDDIAQTHDAAARVFKEL